MRGRVTFLILTAACLAGTAPAQGRATGHGGGRQQGQLGDRLTRIAARIARDRQGNLICEGQAAFMMQDLDRVWVDATRSGAGERAIGPMERASYAAMLRRVELRLDAAETTHAPALPAGRRSVRE